MHISYGDKDLLDTASFIVVGIGVTKIVVEKGSESVTVLLEWIKAEGKEAALAFQNVDQRSLKLTLTNWDNPNGIALGEEPLEIGTFNNRKLYLALFVRRAGSRGEQRLATISFYLGPEVSRG